MPRLPKHLAELPNGTCRTCLTVGDCTRTSPRKCRRCVREMKRKRQASLRVRQIMRNPICKRCKQPGEFTPAEPYTCKACRNEKYRARYHRDSTAKNEPGWLRRRKAKQQLPEVKAALAKLAKKRRRVDLLAREAEIRANRRNRLRKYNITEEQYAAMHTAQNALCAICKHTDPRMRLGRYFNLSVDHCHATGVVRGLLCQYCNTGLGAFKDSIESLQNAVKYLRKAKRGTR